MMRVGDKVVCIAPEDTPCATPVRPGYLQVLRVSEIRVRKNQAWLIFYDLTRDYGFHPSFFRPLHDDEFRKIMREITKNPVVLP